MAGTIAASVIKNDTTSPPAFQNSAGTEIGRLCRASVQFVGSTATINASFNVSSVTRSGTGTYTVNFTNSFADTNYSVSGTTSATLGGLNTFTTTTFNVGSLAIQAVGLSAGAATATDPATVSVSVFR